MVLVHHRVAQAQLRQVADDRVRVARRLCPAPPLGDALAVQLGFGDDGNGRFPQQQPFFQGGHTQAEPLLAGEKGGPVVIGRREEAVILQQAAQDLAPPRGLRHHQDAAGIGLEPGKQRAVW